MRKRPAKMDEDQYQLGIRQLSPHQMVALIVRYRGMVQRANHILDSLITSDTCLLNDIQTEYIKCTMKDFDRWTTDYTTVLAFDEDEEEEE